MSFWHVLSSGSIGAHSHNQLAEGEGGGGGEGVAPLLKSRDPQLAGWEIVISHVSLQHAFLLASIPYNIYTYTRVYPSMYICILYIYIKKNAYLHTHLINMSVCLSVSLSIYSFYSILF